jgi:hypothetical protein
MDANQYLRRLAESCPKVISRTTCVSASQYTESLGLMANTVYASKSDRKALEPTLACNIAKPSTTGSDVEPVKPANGCPSQGICTSFSLRYQQPAFTLPGCDYPTLSTTYTQVCVKPTYCGTPAQQKAAAALAVNREIYPNCCTTNPFPLSG